MKPRHLDNPQLVCYPRHRVSGTWQLFSAAVVETAPIGVFDVTSHNPHFRFSQSTLDHNAKKKGTLRRGVGSCHVGAGHIIAGGQYLFAELPFVIAPHSKTNHAGTNQQYGSRFRCGSAVFGRQIVGGHSGCPRGVAVTIARDLISVGQVFNRTGRNGRHLRSTPCKSVHVHSRGRNTASESQVFRERTGERPVFYSVGRIHNHGTPPVVQVHEPRSGAVKSHPWCYYERLKDIDTSGARVDDVWRCLCSDYPNCVCLYGSDAYQKKPRSESKGEEICFHAINSKEEVNNMIDRYYPGGTKTTI